jgi:UDP-GlcNAc3NAcA epimerase
MSDVFFNQPGTNKPNYILNVASGNNGIQTVKMIIEIETILEDQKPDGMVVYVDDNSLQKK